MFDWITVLIAETGYAGIFLLMVGENIFPPIPSELIMPLAGYVAATGRLDFALVAISGSLGSLVGAVFWYLVGRWVGFPRLLRWAAKSGRWMAVTPDELETARRWFARNGAVAVLIGRLLPTIRTLISIPAGISGMAFPGFLLFSGIGTTVFTTVLAGLGFVLKEEFQRVETYLNPLSTALVVVAVVVYLWRVAIFHAPDRD